ncbi:ABC transporter [Microlunatus endophyticus]|uniref:ABC transporter n=1 Tax=Microlunatus endophyticus TaxID=1716077 RepID=A0A917RZG2_9ACTN|nr:ATP-binding cassette domain-containing protein [Microlunatus endophyticus]GGL47954.1 ABC transporter [Microlunatus endophyticus]
MPVIHASGLTKTYRFHRSRVGLGGAITDLFRRRYDTRVAVADLDLRIDEGEFVGLLGRNGAGKTTTLKMFSGLLRPSAGALDVLGHQPSARRFEYLRQIAVVLGSKSMLWWDVSTRASLDLHQAIYDLPRPMYAESVDQLAGLLELSDVIDIPVRQLSLGQRMKCELAVALVHQPKLLFLDEPTIGLDVVSKAAVRRFLAKINSEYGITVVLTSHDMDDVSELCRRLVLIDHGSLQFDGTPDELVRQTRPRKRITLTYAGPPGQVELEVDREDTQRVLAEAAGRGELLDLEVRDADLDDVMQAVMGA